MGLKDMGWKDIGVYGADRSYKPKGAEGSRSIGEEEHPVFSSKAKVMLKALNPSHG